MRTRLPRRNESSRLVAAVRARLRVAAAYLWRQWIRPIAPIVLLALTFRGAVADWNDVPTGSMKPTIVEGDRIFVNKLAYGLRIPLTSTWIAQWSGPERGEIVVLFSPADGSRLVKRVIGLPGDVIAMSYNRLQINGQPLAYAPASAAANSQLPNQAQRQIVASETLGEHPHSVMATPGAAAPRTFGPIKVPADCYFVMGDNRDCSADSRVFGFVQRELIVGRSGRVVLSLDRDNWHCPRADRFWLELP